MVNKDIKDNNWPNFVCTFSDKGRFDVCMTEKGKHVNYQRIGQLDKKVSIVTDKRDQCVIRKVSIYNSYVMKLNM